ncbi:beta-1,3-galactosyltransferase 1-like [Physella acuta]|uniref:beta-1,3-galactosyltransferase 1-like n=1 Tax=Physella acuta TaxID=109671 RepID=UPI0027DC4551|nr:beta-1,3-galactosyltransferase 1-like [Physella acuta]
MHWNVLRLDHYEHFYLTHVKQQNVRSQSIKARSGTYVLALALKQQGISLLVSTHLHLRMISLGIRPRLQFKYVKLSFALIFACGIAALINNTSKRSPLSVFSVSSINAIWELERNITQRVWFNQMKTNQTKPKNATKSPPTYSAQDLKKFPFLNEPVINSHNYKYIISPNVTCEGRDEIELFIGVATRLDNFKGRQAIRETWGSYANVSSHNSILVFFIGQPEPGYPKASLKQKLLLKESAKYGDILQEDYLDCYHNLSLKSVSIIKYVSTYCSKAKYILKADEDMYINFNCLIDSLKKNQVKKPKLKAFVMGTKYVKPPPIRSTKSKWYISKADYPKSRYPDYVSGGAYVLSAQASWLLYQASLRLPLFRWEDVYVTGMCSKKAGVEVIDNDRFTYEMYDVSDIRSRISGHPYTPTEMREMYSELKSDTSCE